MRSISNTCSQSRCPDREKSGHENGHHRHCTKKLYIVGIGPGKSDQLSEHARSVLLEVECVAGYSTYIDLIKPLIQGKTLINTGMTKEVERVSAAIDTALSGKSTAIVSSGDPGIYAMAGLTFEILKERNISLSQPLPTSNEKSDEEKRIHVEVIPGIPALSSCGSLLGAPLTHDFAVISLSDLLTPLPLIEKRLEAAASADFVIVLYNPKSKKRVSHLETARNIVLKHRDEDTPVGIVTAGYRKNQSIVLTTLKDLPSADVNMQSTVFIGNSKTFTLDGFMVTPRGYANKYDLKEKGGFKEPDNE